MKKSFFLITALALLSLTGCKKNTQTCTPTVPGVTVPDAEVAAVESYLVGKGLMAAVTLHPKKFYYRINSAGSGLTPNSCSNVLVKYRGALTNDTVFTSPEELNTGAVFNLGQLIAGWQLGLSLIQKGGNITLYLPPSLAYGSNSTPSIPANSVLIFDISLVDVANQ